MNLRTCLFFASIVVFSFSCTDELSEPDEVSQNSAAVEWCSTTDLDAGNTCQAYGAGCGQTVQAWTSANTGYTRYWWPNPIQRYCEWGPDDWRMYWYDPYPANFFNRNSIRLRYQGTLAHCIQNYRADWLINASGTLYLRAQFSRNPGYQGQCAKSDYVMVAP